MNSKIILFTVCGIFIVIYVTIKLKFTSNINQCLVNNDNKLFDYLNKFYTRFLLTPFKIELTKLKFYMLNKDSSGIKNQIDFIENKMRLTSKQKAIIAEHTFYQYLNDKDYKKCDECLKLIKQTDYKCNDLPYMEMIVDIFYKGSAEYLDKLQEAHSKAKQSNDVKTMKSLELLIEQSKKNNQK